LFRYFSKDEWAEAFLNGSIFLNSLSFFHGIEDGHARGDELEGIMQHTPPSGLEINNLTTGTKQLLPGWSFRSRVAAHEVFVLCMSRSRTQRHWKEFDAVAYVEIIDKKHFLKALQGAATAQGLDSKAAAVTYTSLDAPPLHNWALPEQVCFRKRKDPYRWQDEYRFAAAPPEFFSVERVQLELSSEPVKHEDRAFGSLTLEIGSVADFCRLHRNP
jgi:hypothetical protein